MIYFAAELEHQQAELTRTRNEQLEEMKQCQAALDEERMCLNKKTKVSITYSWFYSFHSRSWQKNNYFQLVDIVIFFFMLLKYVLHVVNSQFLNKFINGGLLMSIVLWFLSLTALNF